MNKQILFFSTMLLALKLLAQSQYASSNQPVFNGKYPYDKRKLSVPPVVQETRFDLNVNPNKINLIRKKLVNSRNIIDGINGINLLQNPLYKPLHTVSTIYLFPNFITTIIFPVQFHISSKPQVSFPCSVFEYDNNTIRIRPKANSRMGNITLNLSNGHRNYSIDIYYKRYLPNIKCEIKKNGNCKNVYLATVIKYTMSKKLNPFVVIADYKKLHNIAKIKIKKNLGYLMFSKGGQTYYIIRDDQFGTIYTDGLALRVTTKL